jgi:hypothetical protein
MKSFSILLLFFSFSSLSSEPIGEIIKTKGSVYKIVQGEEQRIEVKVGDKILEGDQINTLIKSFTKISLIDGSNIVVGPNSLFHIKELNVDQDKRQNKFDILKGKIRAKINTVKEGKDEILFNSRVVSIGVRGTEFLINSYDVKGLPSDDVALLEGKVNANLEKIDFPQNNIDLDPGQAFNSNKLSQTKSLDSIQTLSAEDLEYLKKNPESFLPELQLPSGEFRNFDKPLTSSASVSLPTAAVAVPISAIPVLAGAGSVAAASKVVAPKRKQKSGNPNTDKLLKDEPWDIRDAILNQAKLAKENECFYWFYKPIPGRGGLERFRREEACDDDDEDYE